MLLLRQTVAEREGITEGIRDTEDEDEFKDNHRRPDSSDCSSSMWKPVAKTDFNQHVRRSHLGYDVSPVQPLPRGATGEWKFWFLQKL